MSSEGIKSIAEAILKWGDPRLQAEADQFRANREANAWRIEREKELFPVKKRQETAAADAAEHALNKAREDKKRADAEKAAVDRIVTFFKGKPGVPVSPGSSETTGAVAPMFRWDKENLVSMHQDATKHIPDMIAAFAEAYGSEKAFELMAKLSSLSVPVGGNKFVTPVGAFALSNTGQPVTNALASQASNSLYGLTRDNVENLVKKAELNSTLSSLYGTEPAPVEGQTDGVFSPRSKAAGGLDPEIEKGIRNSLNLDLNRMFGPLQGSPASPSGVPAGSTGSTGIPAIISGTDMVASSSTPGQASPSPSPSTSASPASSSSSVPSPSTSASAVTSSEPPVPSPSTSAAPASSTPSTSEAPTLASLISGSDEGGDAALTRLQYEAKRKEADRLLAAPPKAIRNKTTGAITYSKDDARTAVQDKEVVDKTQADILATENLRVLREKRDQQRSEDEANFKQRAMELIKIQLSKDTADKRNTLPADIQDWLSDRAIQVKRSLEMTLPLSEAKERAVEVVMEEFSKLYEQDHESFGGAKIVKAGDAKSNWPVSGVDSGTITKQKGPLDVAISNRVNQTPNEQRKANVYLDGFPGITDKMRENPTIARGIVRLQFLRDVVEKGEAATPDVNTGRYTLKRFSQKEIEEKKKQIEALDTMLKQEIAKL